VSSGMSHLERRLQCVTVHRVTSEYRAKRTHADIHTIDAGTSVQATFVQAHCTTSESLLPSYPYSTAQARRAPWTEEAIERILPLPVFADGYLKQYAVP